MTPTKAISRPRLSSPLMAPGTWAPKMPRVRKTTLIVLTAVVYLVLSHTSQTGALPRPPDYWRQALNSDAASMPNEPAMVGNDTLGFHKIFVINRPSRSDRRDPLSLAAALTGIRLSYSDGVDGSEVQDRVLPADSEGKGIRKGNIGSWRAHMNVLRTVVEEGIETALVLEDDTDWDVRLKQQLQTFSLASRAFLQPPAGLDPRGRSLVTLARGEAATTNPATVALSKAPKTPRPRTSPYGDDWDLLWLGHCGTELPGGDQEHDITSDTDRREDAPSRQTSLRIIAIGDDETVPAPRHLRPHPFADRLDRLGTLYPPRTRLVHASRATTCTLGYAVSQRGAQRLLWRFGIDTFTTGFDLMMRDWCDGRYHADSGDENGDGGKGGAAGHGTGQRSAHHRPVCLTVQPPIFSHFASGRRDGGSDIQGVGGGYVRRSGSQYIRLSVRQNLGRLVDGASVEELVDQWPDDKN